MIIIVPKSADTLKMHCMAIGIGAPNWEPPFAGKYGSRSGMDSQEAINQNVAEGQRRKDSITKIRMEA